MVFGTKQGRLKDGTQVTLRPMTASDEEALFRFFQDLPDETLIFIRHDVKERRVIQEWAQRLDHNRVLPLLGLVGDEIVADVTLHRVPHGWKRHIGRVRVVVGTAYKSSGWRRSCSMKSWNSPVSWVWRNCGRRCLWIPGAPSGLSAMPDLCARR
jgi:hypothetical protein